MKKNSTQSNSKRREFFGLLGGGIFAAAAFTASPFKGLAKNAKQAAAQAPKEGLKVNIHPLAVKRNNKV